MWDEFPRVPTAEWETAIRADLKGADYDKKLLWRTDEGITVGPFYRAEDLPATAGQARFTGTWQIAAGSDIPKDAVRGDLLHEQGATAVQELGYGLAESQGKRNIFVFSVGTNYFFEIAKLRAARQLWARLSSDPVILWSRTSLADKSLYDPAANLMRCTTEAMSAIFGGCDFLVIESARFPEHLARSLGRILREESHFEEVSDPGGGSYYIESLTASIASEAWKIYESGLQGGDAAIAAARAAKEKAVAQRKRTLVGVNNYPDVNETLPPDAALPPSPWRMAEPFEAIRRRVEKFSKRPRVLLLQRGNVKMRMARANFCLNLFGCAGFEVKTSETLEPSDLVVLCSSDPEYLAFAQEICRQSKSPVLVAGNPKEQIEALRGAGVKDFAYLGMDAVKFLAQWLEALA
ncbi:MAG: methylmalonyl-CoA mutase family protein [Candidatus Acidiferrum sp.]|jgi:methylmalonyl-CoA mutase